MKCGTEIGLTCNKINCILLIYFIHFGQYIFVFMLSAHKIKSEIVLINYFCLQNKFSGFIFLIIHEEKMITSLTEG